MIINIVVIRIVRYFKIPVALTEVLKSNPVTRDMYPTEIGEIEVKPGTIWDFGSRMERNLLVYCVKGEGIVILSGEQVPLTKDQFFIVPKGDEFKFYSDINHNSRFYTAQFDGKKAGLHGKEFLLVRNVVPSISNRVANRELLFEEIFNNLARGYHNENLEYISYCFGHLLATFVYAHKTSDDLADEANPLMRRSIEFMNKNIGKKLTLDEISSEAGYSPTYFTTLFKKETGYSPLSYFSHLKILKATEFLDYTGNKVKEISFYLGYSDPYYFTKDFKKKMGMSPRQYRNRVG